MRHAASLTLLQDMQVGERTESSIRALRLCSISSIFMKMEHPGRPVGTYQALSSIGYYL